MKRGIIWLIICCHCCALHSQNPSDSLQTIWENESEPDSVRFNALDRYYELNNQSQPDSALLALDYHYQLAKSKNSISQQFHSAKRKGNVHRLKENYETAMTSYQEAEDLAIKLNDDILKASIKGNMGNVFVYRQDYKEATRHFSDALKVYQDLEDFDGESHMLTSLGSVFLIINNYDLAREYYQNALNILAERGYEDRRTAIIYINIGWANFETESYEEAQVYYEKGLKLLQLKNEKFFIASCYSTLAKIHLHQDDLDHALDYAEKNLALTQELGLAEGITGAEITWAQVIYESDVDRATLKGEEILAELKPNANKDLKMTLYELLYKCYKSQNKLELSLGMLEKFNLYQDSIQVEKNQFAVIREAIESDFEQRIHQIEIENERSQSEIKLEQTNRIYLVIFVSLIILAGVFGYFRSRAVKQEKHKKELLEQIITLKNAKGEKVQLTTPSFELNRSQLEKHINRKLNETDWTVLTILLDDPVISNKGIAEKAYLSVDGIGSSLRRMYQYFDIKESKYKKISLLMTAMKLSS